jgi:hypothetical protein
LFICGRTLFAVLCGLCVLCGSLSSKQKEPASDSPARRWLG